MSDEDFEFEPDLSSLGGDWNDNGGDSIAEGDDEESLLSKGLSQTQVTLIVYKVSLHVQSILEITLSMIEVKRRDE